MKKSVKRSGSQKGMLVPAVVSKLPGLSPIDNSDPVEDLGKAFKHGMCLRSRSASVSLKKKASPPPVITRPDSLIGSRASGGMTLRPRKKALPQPRSALLTEPTEKEKEKENLPPVPVRTSKLLNREKKNQPSVPVRSSKLPDREKEEKPVRATRQSKWEKDMIQCFEDRIKRIISPMGFTHRERSLCSDYMVKRDFEYMELDALPKEYRHVKAYIDQIRRTKGYGVTMRYPAGYIGKHFDAYYRVWEKKAEVKKYVEKMIKMVLADMKNKFPDKNYEAGEGIENLVRSNWAHLLTIQVHQGTPADPPEMVEAYFFAPPLGPIVEHLELLEWKIRRGSEVIFCTEEIIDYLY